MSILIRGMEMPTSCSDCRLMADGWCYACEPESAEERRRITTNYCPLIEIPPHGDLIDKKTVTDNLCKILTNAKPPTNYPNWNDAIIAVMTAPTIIPAEEET